MQRALDRGATGDIVREARAAIIVLAFYANGKGLSEIVSAAKRWPQPAPRTVTLAGPARVAVRQIAGVLARRIVCRVRVGDRVERGERYGLIRFGSRTDLFVPRASAVRVKVGDRVRGGETIMALLP